MSLLHVIQNNLNINLLNVDALTTFSNMLLIKKEASDALASILQMESDFEEFPFSGKLTYREELMTFTFYQTKDLKEPLTALILAIENETYTEMALLSADHSAPYLFSESKALFHKLTSKIADAVINVEQCLIKSGWIISDFDYDYTNTHTLTKESVLGLIIAKEGICTSFFHNGDNNYPQFFCLIPSRKIETELFKELKIIE